MRITDVVGLVTGGKRRERMLAVALLGAITATLVPALGAASTASPAGAARPRSVVHAGFRRQGRVHEHAGRTVELSAVPALRRGARSAGPARAAPLGVGTSNTHFAALQAAARTSSAAPRPAQAPHRPPTVAGGHGLYTPMDTKAFGGLSDSAATCPYSGGCAP